MLGNLRIKRVFPLQNRSDLSENYSDLRRYAYLGNVLDRQSFWPESIQQHQIETIYHTRAYKHVPLVEANASQGVYTNVCGLSMSLRPQSRIRLVI
jgi:FlaA1/EpsC-like NDP-sugar epimerase